MMNPRQKIFYVFCMLCVFFFTLLALPMSLWAAKKAKSPKGISARSVIFSNSTKVRRLYGKNVNKRVPPASTVKVMTALLAMERLSLDQTVTASSNVVYPQPSKIYIQPGEQYDIKSLLYAILLKSANDAAVALAEAVAGSEEKFVALMNKKAKELGCKNTKFSNAHGLPKPTAQYTTAYDMYLIFRAALKYPFFREAISTKQKTISSKAGREISLKSHNHILSSEWNQKIYGKTGYTHAARSCFVGYTKKGADDLIIAIFGCASGKRWNEIKRIVSKYGGIAL